MAEVYEMNDFMQMIGEIFWKEKKFSKNAGGAPDADSFRGFGPTEQYWDVPTANGWTVRYGDNGAGIASAVSPTGETWESNFRAKNTSMHQVSKK